MSRSMFPVQVPPGFGPYDNGGRTEKADEWTMHLIATRACVDDEMGGV